MEAPKIGTSEVPNAQLTAEVCKTDCLGRQVIAEYEYVSPTYVLTLISLPSLVGVAGRVAGENGHVSGG